MGAGGETSPRSAFAPCALKAYKLEGEMENEILLMQCGEALENCLTTMVDLGAPDSLCELIEAKNTLGKLNRLFGLKEDVFFSVLLEKMSLLTQEQN